MKIRNLEQLDLLLDKDLAWRKKELINIKLIIDNELNTDKSFLLRAGIALLCAHWEGFVKLASNYYVIYIASLKIKTKDLKENFLALMLKKNFIECGKSPKCTIHTELIKKIEEKKDSHFFIKYTEDNKIISTKSNLSSTLLAEILDSLALENRYLLKSNYIDKNLLEMRHAIVHGEQRELDISDFNNTFDTIFDLINEFKEQISDAAENELYKK